MRLIDIDSSNWRTVAALEVSPEQSAYVAAPAWYLCLGFYGGDWHPLAIEADDEIVGHLMWAVDTDDSSTWLGGLIIDVAHQGRGFGRAAVERFIERFEDNLALSFSPENTVARSLYLDLGFVETGETEGDELVARYHAH